MHLAHDISSYILSDMELLLCSFFASLLFSFLCNIFEFRLQIILWFIFFGESLREKKDITLFGQKEQTEYFFKNIFSKHLKSSTITTERRNQQPQRVKTVQEEALRYNLKKNKKTSREKRRCKRIETKNER